MEVLSPQVLSFCIRAFRDQRSLEMFGRNRVRSCFIFLAQDDFR